MDDNFRKLESKLDKLDDRLDSVDKTLIRQEENLKEHMRRSVAAEESIQILREELKPVQKHMNHMEGALKLLGGITLILAVLEAIRRIGFQ